MDGDFGIERAKKHPFFQSKTISAKTSAADDDDDYVFLDVDAGVYVFAIDCLKIIHTYIHSMPSSDFSQGIGALKIARLVCLQNKNCWHCNHNII